MKIEFEGRRRTNCLSVSSYWTVTLFPGRSACTLEKIEYIIIIDNNNNNSLFVRRKIAYKYDLILEAAKRTSKTVIAATTTVETSSVENLKSEKPSKMLLGKARQ